MQLRDFFPLSIQPSGGGDVELCVIIILSYTEFHNASAKAFGERSHGGYGGVGIIPIPCLPPKLNNIRPKPFRPPDQGSVFQNAYNPCSRI